MAMNRKIHEKKRSRHSRSNISKFSGVTEENYGNLTQDIGSPKRDIPNTRVYPKFSGLSHDEKNNNNNNKHSLRSITKGYDGKTH